MMAQAAGMVTLERFDPQSDLALLSAWLSAPHVARFWGDPDPNLSKARQRDPGSHALIAVGGTPVGYLCWQKPSSHELEDAGLADLPPGLVDIDILIGDPNCIGLGIGPRAMAELLARLKKEGIAFAGVGTSVLNRAAIRAYEKSGFRPFREFHEAESGRCLYMVIELKSSRPGVQAAPRIPAQGCGG